MIKRFKAKGIIGIPDCDIVLGDEKKIVITGPNGSGKTSLLKQITHPLASHDRINRVKPGVDEATTEMEIDYYGVKYKIVHLYNRPKPGQSPKVLSYLFKEEKPGSGKMVNLVENGLPSNFKAVVEKELEYNDYLYDILNIGSHNRGLIEQTNANRLEYLKKVTKEDVLSTVKDSVNNKFTEFTTNGKYITNEISKLGQKEEIERKIVLLNSESLKLSQERDTLQKKLNELENSKVDNLEDLNNRLVIQKRKLKKYEELKDVLNSVVDDKELLNSLTYNSLYEIYNKEYIVINTKLDNISERIEKLNEDLVKIKDMNNEELIKEKDYLQKLRDDIVKKYKGKSYPEIKSSSLDIVNNYIQMLLDRLDDIDNRNLFKELIESEKYKDYVDEIVTKQEEVVTRISKIKNDLDKLSFSKNLVSLNYPDECTMVNCQLRLEFENQVKNLSIYQLLTDDLNKCENEMKHLEDEYSERSSLVYKINDFLEIFNKSKVFELSNKYNKTKRNKLLDTKKLNNLSILINNHVMYNKDMEDLDRINVKLDSLSAVVRIEEQNTEKRTQIIIEEMESLEEEEKNIKLRYRTVSDHFNKLKSLDLDSDLKDIVYKDIESERLATTEHVMELINKIDIINNIDIKKKELENQIVEKNKELKENTDLYYSQKQELDRIEQLTKEFNSVQEHLNKLKTLKEVVGKLLPARIMESYLYDIAKMVNFLLDGIMTIRFDTSEGVDIYCTIKAIERPVNVLSQGERSMLSVALLIAFKKMIKWDVISIDEGSAALDENNKDRYMSMITKYIESINTINQVFIVSHDFFVSDGMDIRILKMGEL